MFGFEPERIVWRAGWVLAVLLSCASNSTAERPPIKTYTTADGMAQNSVNRIVRDSRGFLWFCTEDGLSRYDGYTFTNYGVEDGLPDNQVRNLFETRAGEYLVATFNGLCRFNPKGRPSQPNQNNNQATRNDGRRTMDDAMFVLCRTNDNSRMETGNALLQDRTGTVWCGTGGGLYRLEQTAGEWTLGFIEIGLPREVENDMTVRALVEDQQGALWIGAGSGLYRLWPDGRTERYTTDHGLPDNDLFALLIDTDGQLWVGTRKGLVQIALEPGTYQPRIIRVYTAKNGLGNPNTRSLFQSSMGQLWVGSSTGLVEFVPQASRERRILHSFVSELVLSKLFVQTLAEDRDGNLWIGTDNGALKLARNGFTTYTEDDGLGESRVSSIFESRAGDLSVMTIFSSATPISWFDGKRFRAIRPRGPRGLAYFGWGWHQLTLQDRAGEWWLPTGQGLVRYPKVDHVGQLAVTPPKAIYTISDGFVSNDIFRLYEDSRGDIWIATFSEARSGISRWERASKTFHHYGEADGLPPRLPIPYSLTEDRAGALWLGLETGGLLRFRAGRFTLFTPESGVPVGAINDLWLDRGGRLWIASELGGLARLDDTSAEQPRFITYTIAQGLSTNRINCITEDKYGRLYLGTGRGLDRLDPETGRVKPFTASDGLIFGEVLVSFRDRQSDLWFGGKGGLSRLSPQPDPPQPPPPVLITGLRVGGETHAISALGETEIHSIEVGPNKNQIEMEFVALGFSPGEGLRYQYKLEGASEDWNELSDQRTVNFAHLAPGRYRFLVRAVNSNGMMSDPPASSSFTILSPIWQRWWFVSIVAVLAGLVANAFYRYRVGRLLEIERVRTRIATDLHDDIGSSLSQIAIMSEVVQQQVDGENQRVSRPLAVIAGTSRELVDSMADIVWAINPQRDHLIDLTQRMRQFAADLLTARNIAFKFAAPGIESDVPLETDIRREVFLIFKEAVNNAVRHSNCSFIEIEFAVHHNRLSLKVGDNGTGFDSREASGGHGLASMKRRAERIGGTLDILSQAASGTTVTLQAPLRRRRRRVLNITT